MKVTRSATWGFAFAGVFLLAAGVRAQPTAAEERFWEQAKKMAPPVQWVEGEVDSRSGTGHATTIDFERRTATIQAVGVAIPDEHPYIAERKSSAITAARAIAYAKVLEGMKAWVQEEIQVRDQKTEFQRVLLRVADWVKGWTEVEDPVVTVEEDGSVSALVTLGDSLDGKKGLNRAIMDDWVRADTLAPTSRHTLPIEPGHEPPSTHEKEAGEPAKPVEEPAAPPEPAKGPIYTGLIINATKLNGRPSIAPKILTPEGNEVYGTLVVKRDWLLNWGVSAYAGSVESAKYALQQRIGYHPLIVDASAVREPGKIDIVVDTDVANRILREEARAGESGAASFLAEGRVVIVLG